MPCFVTEGEILVQTQTEGDTTMHCMMGEGAKQSTWGLLCNNCFTIQLQPLVKKLPFNTIENLTAVHSGSLWIKVSFSSSHSDCRSYVIIIVYFTIFKTK